MKGAYGIAKWLTERYGPIKEDIQFLTSVQGVFENKGFPHHNKTSPDGGANQGR